MSENIEGCCQHPQDKPSSEGGWSGLCGNREGTELSQLDQEIVMYPFGYRMAPIIHPQLRVYPEDVGNTPLSISVMCRLLDASDPFQPFTGTVFPGI